MVVEKLEELKLPFDERNVSEKENVEELMRRGKLPQVPYLIDETRGEAMYESDIIADYLEKHYGTHA